MNIHFYTSFISWWVVKTTKAATNLNVKVVEKLVIDMGHVVDSIFTILQDFPEVRKIRMLTAYEFYFWAKANPDPLKETRDLMNAMRSKNYGSE